jgi:hypothetical protein
MKINNPITCALVTLGLVSAGSIAKADITGVTIGGQTYTEVFVCGSTAARGNMFNSVFAASGGAFTGGPVGTMPARANITSGTSAYSAWGVINGQNVCLCFDWSGSEAGLWALQHQSVGIPNPIAAGTLNGNPAFPNAVIPGTPSPTAFVDPNTGAAFTATADLAMADTSQAVSLSPAPPFSVLTDYGIIGAVTFEWVVGNNSTPDGSWTDMSNISDWQANTLLGTTPQVADYFTGNVNDQDDVYVVGRNKASGTHQNTMLITQHGTTTAVNQWVVNDASYSGSGQLTVGAVESIKTAGGITSVANDGWDSGGNVAKTLECDASGFTDSFGFPVVMLGYLGISDAQSAITATGSNAKALSTDGVAENDETVENGTYPFWGHEHLYGTSTEDSTVQTVGHAFAGTVKVTAFNRTTPNGALEASGGLGGGEVNLSGTQSAIISPQFMAADKPGGGDAGYPAQTGL